jgi:mannose-1-phosphate guanylyltransferase
MNKETLRLKEHLYVLILCGGSGTRLWPLSRSKSSKQFIRLTGPKSTFEETVDRVKGIVSKDRIYVITDQEHAKDVRKQFPNLSKDNLIIEPMRRDTALAMGTAASYVMAKDPLAVIINTGADHVIKDRVAYKKAIFAAAQVALDTEKLVVIGVEPSFPHTGFGYIYSPELYKTELGEKVYSVKKFHEKPSFKVAQGYLEKGNFYWNTNFYVWKASSFLSSAKRHMPRLSAGLTKIKKSIGTDSENEVLKSVYQMAQSISVDYAISEKEKNMYLVVGKFDWVDVGDWEEVWKLSPKDKQGNFLKVKKNSSVYTLDTHNSYVISSKKLVAMIGITDLVVIETNDVLLIIDKKNAELVKQIVNKLKEEGKKELL